MDQVRAYQEKSARKSDFERTELAKEKTGVKLEGVEGINPGKRSKKSPSLSPTMC